MVTADLSRVERFVEEAVKGSEVAEDVVELVAGERHLSTLSDGLESYACVLATTPWRISAELLYLYVCSFGKEARRFH